MAGRKAGAGNRDHAPEKRTNHANSYYTDVEWAAVTRAATAAGLRPGAWIARTAVAEAEVRNGQRRPDWEGLLDVAEELRQVRWLLGNIAGNLNDVARVANSTGEIGEEAGTVLGLVRRIAGRADASLGELKEQTR